MNTLLIHWTAWFPDGTKKVGIAWSEAEYDSIQVEYVIAEFTSWR